MIWGVSPSKVWQQAWNDNNRTSATDWIDYVATTPAQIISIAVWDGRIIVGRFDGLYEIDISDPLAISGDWKSPPVDNVTKPVLALSIGRESDPAGNPSQPVLCYATPDEVVKLFPNNLRQILPLPVATGEISVISLHAQGATLWAGTVAHGIYKWEANSGWSRILEPSLPTSLPLKQADEIGLISLMLTSDTNLNFVLLNNHISLETVVQPSCPLVFITPDPATQLYPCKAGTVILALRNQQNVPVTLTVARAGNIVTIT